MNTCDVMLAGWIAIFVAVMVWNLWGIQHLRREWQRVFPKEERPTIKELLDDADNDKP